MIYLLFIIDTQNVNEPVRLIENIIIIGIKDSNIEYNNRFFITFLYFLVFK